MYTLITGASSGIGRQAAVELSENRKLILAGRNLAELELTRELCKGDSHLLWEVDLSDISNLENNFVSFSKSKSSQVNEFVHCAGYVRSDPIRQINVEQIENHFHTNVFSAILITKLLLSKKINQKLLKNVVFVSSIFSSFGSSGHVLYSSSKGALDSAMKSIAAEAAPDFRINSIQLGAIATRMSENVLNDVNLQKQYPLGIGTPQDAADLIAFLLSESSKWMTGQALILDGGKTNNQSNKIES